VGADLTEMNNKYTQMNNFLMEIQTTQITVNNQILKHYNDNYSDLIESQITQSADQKFNAKDSEELASESLSEGITETTETDTTEGDSANPNAVENASITVESTLAQANESEANNGESNTETTAPVVENSSSTEPKKNNVTFNIE